MLWECFESAEGEMLEFWWWNEEFIVWKFIPFEPKSRPLFSLICMQIQKVHLDEFLLGFCQYLTNSFFSSQFIAISLENFVIKPSSLKVFSWDPKILNLLLYCHSKITFLMCPGQSFSHNNYHCSSLIGLSFIVALSREEKNRFHYKSLRSVMKNNGPLLFSTSDSCFIW